MGVKGFRIDGAKHMASQEIAAILKGLTMPGGGSPYIYQEVIDTNQTERVRDSEYTPAGDVMEFEYGMTVIGSKFNCGGHLSDLQNVPEYNNMLPSRFAVVFTDNHDNQRGHGAGGPCIVDHRDGQLYNLANIFMLAYPYGYPMITSSYYWSSDPNSKQGDGKGPPSADPPFTAGSGPEHAARLWPEPGGGRYASELLRDVRGWQVGVRTPAHRAREHGGVSQGGGRRGSHELAEHRRAGERSHRVRPRGPGLCGDQPDGERGNDVLHDGDAAGRRTATSRSSTSTRPPEDAHLPVARPRPRIR